MPTIYEVPIVDIGNQKAFREVVLKFLCSSFSCISETVLGLF